MSDAAPSTDEMESRRLLGDDDARPSFAHQIAHGEASDESAPASVSVHDPDRAQRVLRGFYALTMSLEVFAVVGLTLFLPILLEQVAREHGLLAPDHVVPCPPSSAARPTVGSAQDDEPPRCAVEIVRGVWLDTASFSMICYSLSVALQALTVISLGSRADSETHRHRLLILFTTLGAGLTMAFLVLPTSTALWPLTALFTIVSNVCFGASVVALNAFLPSLAACDPSVVAAAEAMYEQLSAFEHLERGSSNERLTRSQAVVRAREAHATEKARVTASISSKSIALGYAAGIVVLVALLVPVTLMNGSTFSLRLALFVCGLWWALGASLSLVWLKTPIPATSDGTQDDAKKRYGDDDDDESTWASIRQGWLSLFRLIREWHRLPQTFVFLSAWFLLSDAFATITSTAMLFGKTTLEMTTSELILIAVLTPASGMAGAFVVPRVQRAREWSNVQTLRALVGAAALVPAWGLVALRRKGEMYALAVVFGSIYGAFQAYARSVFASLIPVSQSATWFGLYSVTDKSSSFVGPLLVALITNATGQVRHGFWLILLMMLSALFVPLALVDVGRGADDAETYEQSLVAP